MFKGQNKEKEPHMKRKGTDEEHRKRQEEKKARIVSQKNGVVGHIKRCTAVSRTEKYLNRLVEWWGQKTNGSMLRNKWKERK